jgi:hypothetical protein
MKLPEDKKERAKWLTMIFMGAALVLVGLYMGVINPLLSAKARMRGEISDLETKIADADKKISIMKRDRAESVTVLADLRTISTKYVLPPVVDNYLLSARPRVEEHSNRLNVKIDPVRAIGLSEVVPAASSPSLKGFSARVSAACGMHDAVRLMHAIESSNPYISVVNVSISGQPLLDRNNHLVTFDIQWPVWIDQELPARIEASLKVDDNKAAPVQQGGG